jgi:hypothetical protein
MSTAKQQPSTNCCPAPYCIRLFKETIRFGVWASYLGASLMAALDAPPTKDADGIKTASTRAAFASTSTVTNEPPRLTPSE